MIHVTTCGLRHADRLLATGRYDALISIGVGEAKHCKTRLDNTLLLDFEDTWPARGKRLCATPDDIGKLINFSVNLPQNAMVLSHCGRGRSRSTAAAIIAYFVTGGGEEHAVRAVFAANSRANPNGYVLHLADEFLKTNLVAECQRYRIKGEW